MQDKEKLLKEFLYSVEKYGLIEGTYITFGNNAKISLGFTKRICELPIDELSLSVRGYNVLKRNNLNTIGDVIDVISDKKLISLRNLGQKTSREIKLNIINLGYSHLSNEEKRAFLMEIVENNRNLNLG